jgi:hypothetical protein
MVSQGEAADAPSAPKQYSEWAAFRASLPLFVVTVGLFTGSAVVFHIARTAGPGGFPLWGLLMTLGFVAAIGATVSWFFAKGAADAPAADPSEETETFDTATGSGRPAPDVLRASEVAVPEAWDESTIPVRRVPRPSVRAVAPAPVASDDVERALDEIAQIEDELEGRGRSTVGRSPAPTQS